jgi:high-affinity nickel permease
MISFLLLGFLIGMSHALEADHLAAVGAMATSGKPSSKRLAFLGASWGLGHTTTLFLLSAVVIVFGFVLSDFLASSLEFFVGIMLVGLGIQVALKLRRSKVHFHVHDHGDGKVHLHAHSHAHEGAKDHSAASAHAHDHKSGFSLKAYSIGLVHGLAGSAGLLVIVAAATQDAMAAMLYVLLFGLGSVAGMGLLTYAISWPLNLGSKGRSEKLVGRFFIAIQAASACLAIYIGVAVMMETGPAVLEGLQALS